MNYYGSLADALIYHTDSGNDLWSDPTKTDAERLSALVRGSRALDGRYGLLFTGAKTGGLAQVRAFPRTGAFDYCAQLEVDAGSVPVAITQAAYELALIELVAAGSLTPSVTAGRLTKSEAVVGAASRSFFSPEELGMTGNPLNSFRPTIMAVEDLLSCYLKPARGFWAAVVV